MTDNFYRAFEDHYRGSRELIKYRLEAYLPFVEPLLAHYPEARALDLGCGRGEWLELLASAGFIVRGVDLDEGMLSASRELGLDVQKSDVLEALKTVNDSSLTVVSAFHLVEHIEFDRLRELVAEALRVLVPGGLLIMETPNPENIVVAGCSFYLDPTHNRPIPPTLLSFVAEHAGFPRVKVVRLQESATLRDPGCPIDLLGVLDGVSPDYAVVAQKWGNGEIVGCNAEAFQREYGLSLHTLATRYTQQAEAKAQQAETKARQAETKARQAEAASNQALMQLQAVYASTSWRITAPVRAVGHLALKLSPRHFKSQIKRLLQHAALYIRRRPRLENAVLRVLYRFPGLKSRLFRVVAGIKTPPARPENVPTDIAHPSPRARQIHADLNAAIERRQKENS